MKTIEVSESALESLKAMAQKLQEERDMLLSVIKLVAPEMRGLGLISSVAREHAKSIDMAIAACQESTKVLDDAARP